MNIEPTQTDEEKLLADLMVELSLLDLEFGDIQLEFNTLTHEISSFRNRYHLRVGFLYAQLDRIEAEIREYLAQLAPEDEELADFAAEARRKANETEEEINSADEEKPAKFIPTASLKKLFRKIASLVHPDRSKNEADKLRRNNFMAQLNAAYEICDEEMMNDILARYELDGEILDTDMLAIQIKKAEKSIEDIEVKIAHMRDTIESLKESRWMKLKTEIETKDATGIDALGDLAEDIYRKISEKQEELSGLYKIHEPDDGSESVSVRTEGEERNSHADLNDTSEDDTSFMSDYLIHRTTRGEKVRSKSEMIIANILHGLQLDYRYEYPIEGSVELGVRRPDFVFFKKDKSIIVWEHLGMLDNKKYASKWEKKLEWYSTNGFIDGESLFITTDKHKEGFDSQRVYEVARIIEALVKS